MSASIWLLSGPNLGELGHRDPAVYGTDTLAELVARFTARAAARDATVQHVQSEFEGELVDVIHRARGDADAIVINPGALTHYSWSLRDALECFPGVKVELHLSNPNAREPFRHTSTIAGVVDGTIAGFGPTGYDLAADAACDLLGGRTAGSS